MSETVKTVVLNTNSDFRRAYWRGKSYKHPALVTYVNKNRAGICRIGITAGKKIGNAVHRNRAKRVIRAAFAQCKPQLISGTGCDIVFVARTKTTYSNSNDIYAVMSEQLKSAGIMKK